MVGLLAACKDDRRGFAEGNRPVPASSATSAASAAVSSVGDAQCDAFLDRLRICSPNGARSQARMREDMIVALASPSTRAEAVGVCAKSFEMLRGACPQPGDPPMPTSSSSAAPLASMSASAGALPAPR